MLKKGISLRGLEVFEVLAASGSVARTAEMTGLSQPAVSQQLRNLESALGADLVDHGKRPMRLTAAGRSFLARTEVVLSELRLAQSELTVMDLTHLDTLSIGLIDDFDNDLTPRLVTILADSLTSCRFKMITAPSHEISEAMVAGDLHVAVAASTGETRETITEYPLVRDPFILVTPQHLTVNPADPLSALRDLPFLRYAREQMIGHQIEVQMTREGMAFEHRFEVGSHLALMAMVARRIGWAITTPLGYMRATRFHDDIAAHPLPFAEFSRTISLFAGSDWSDQVPREIAQTVRRLVQAQMIDPATSRLPWLNGRLRIIPD
ncbi:LysR family transcriptional regulator [Aestuariivita sp.]|uniref:LysR family transcriptional regulator n=1 Tax=Aestuariivita sp. TaxID=1872407 RepID=UPI0021748BC5|nr:LysR family transcriptional regulator [Aestuariivita sp.]MCE8007998.1 LysR family transcriptional regulator [Aestuariivita sp.]